MKKAKFEDKNLEDEVDRKTRIAVRKGVDHEEHLPRYGLPVDDPYLKDTILRKISSNPLFDAKAITVEVKHGRVKIHGHLSDYLLKSSLLEFIKDEEGVEEFEDQMTVEHEWVPRRKLDPEVTQDYD